MSPQNKEDEAVTPYMQINLAVINEQVIYLNYLYLPSMARAELC
jgi:hypothetical protein